MVAEDLPFERAGEGVVVAALDVVCEIPVLAQHVGAAVKFDGLVESAVLRVVLETGDPALGLHLRDELPFDFLESPS